MAGANRPRVRVLTTGGTIASTRDEATGALRAATSGEELVAAVPGLVDLATIEVDEVALVHSWDIDLALMADLARRVDSAAADGVDGVVVTHGTDTMEETAFALDLLIQSGIPVVVTGAMRAGSVPGSDGPGNLLGAVRVAGSRHVHGAGCVLVMNDEIHAARWVHKSHTTALAAFTSPDTGRLGTIDDDRVVLRWRPPRIPPLRRPDGAVPDPADEVALVWTFPGAPARMLEASAEGARGVVIAGSGSGNVPATWSPVVRQLLADGVPVVLASRCEGGRVTPVYGGDGGGRTLVDAGVVPASDVSALKARIALAFALGADIDRQQLPDLFHRLG